MLPCRQTRRTIAAEFAGNSRRDDFLSTSGSPLVGGLLSRERRWGWDGASLESASVVADDPIGYDSRDFNLYRYVSNKPTTLVDPLGYYDDGRTSCSLDDRRCIADSVQRLLDIEKLLENPHISPESRRRLIEHARNLLNIMSQCGLGHADFPYGNVFDFTREDHDFLTSPYVNWWAHFQCLAESMEQVQRAIAQCDRRAFEGALHRGQDCWSHWLPGYRPPLGHLCDRHEPDHVDTPTKVLAWMDAYLWTLNMVQAWEANCGQEDAQK
jgi:hypothetical protein